jgi:hypothetical protein
MSDSKLWFILENNEIISIFDDQEKALEERFYLKEENPLDKYKLYGLSISDLDDYPDEKEFALENGFLESTTSEDF